jgi:hypothetical protein
METKTPVKNPALRVIGWVLLFGLLGGLLSCLAAYGIAWKWFVPWRTLPALPEPAKSIAGATVSAVDVETQSGRFLRFIPEAGRIDWSPIDTPETETDEGCEPFNRARSLNNVIDQQVVCRNYADGGSTAVYALRSDGRVYAWHAGDSAYDSLLLFIFPAVCAPVGMGIGLVIGLLRNRKKTAASSVQGAS